MPTTNPIAAPPKRRWFQYSLRTLFVVVTVICVLLGTVVHFRTHLYLQYMMARGNFADVKAIPTSPMPDTPVPKDWVSCRFGSLQIRLPSKMAENARTQGKLRVFSDGSKSVVVDLPQRTSDWDEYVTTDLKLPPEGQGLSRPRLRLVCYQVCSSDFRWSMSQEEIRWYTWRLVMSRLLRLEAEGPAETMFGSDFDGILLFNDDHVHATFEWQDKRKAVDGFIHFRDPSGELGLIFVRSVCKSVEVCEEPDSDASSDKK